MSNEDLKILTEDICHVQGQYYKIGYSLYTFYDEKDCHKAHCAFAGTPCGGICQDVGNVINQYYFIRTSPIELLLKEL